MGHRGEDGGHNSLQHYILLTVLEVYAEQPVDCDARCGYDYAVESYVVDGFHFLGVRYRFLMYWAYPRRMKMAVQNKKCSIIKYAVNIYHFLPEDPCSACETIGVFGGLVPVVYQLLPVSCMRISPRSGGFGMVGGCITNLYHGSDLGKTSGLIAFTISGLRH